MSTSTPTRTRRLRALCAAMTAGALLCISGPVAGQDPGAVISGRIMTDTGAPAPGVSVRIAGTSRAAVTNEAGVFRFTGLPPGDHELVIEQIGWNAVRRVVRATSDTAARFELRLEPRALLLDRVIVTTSREEQRRAETPATVHSVSGEDIERLRPSHPSELMNRVPGVWVNVTGGEGHMAAIRHPMTTNPVYLYLENGVPTRSTGFFNHNALYEMDVPHAARVEVVKGPATALYGSDAIGGLVNVLTRAPADAAPFSVTGEAGSFGFGRMLASASSGAVLGELNITRTNGWRDGTSYDRQSGTLRWDHGSETTLLRTMLSYSRIDQNTAGTSALPEEAYLSTPRLNLTPVSFREVHAVRASAALEHVRGSTLFSVTPFARWNAMEMLPNWSLTWDPVISKTGHASAGALVKVRHDFGPSGLRAIAGFDLDYSPGSHREWQITTTREGGVFRDYTRGDLVYDYDVSFRSISPYIQLEAAPLPAVRVVAGLRYDVLAYDYDNMMGELQTGSHRRPGSTNVTYEHVSPKLGIVWAPVDAFRVFGSFGHGFRAPSESQLFRQGRAASTLDLRPVRANNLELGAGGIIGSRLSWDLALYRMRKENDLLTFTRTDGSIETVNAGETLHSGIEVGAAAALPAGLRLDIAFSRAFHTYERWSPRAATDYSGNSMEAAPVRTASAAVTWSPERWHRASASIDIQHVGPYWMDAANTSRYGGHTTVALRAEVPVTSRVALSGRLTNALNERYAELAQYTAARGREFAPGMPRALHVAVRFQ